MTLDTTIDVIEIQREQSVQILPDIRTGVGQNILAWNITGRGPLLPAKGTRERERELLKLYRHDDNMVFKGAISGLTKRVQSTPWEVKGEPKQANYFQQVLMESDFGAGWENLLSKLIIGYSRADAGAFIELIGPGSTIEPMTGAITGLAVLDSLRCYPTGDPEFPVIYYDAYGAMHALHYTRVVRFVDMPEASEDAFFYGECALSRCASPVTRQILMARYIEQTLDDNPPPGIAIFKNLSDKEVQTAYARLEQERSTDAKGQWGKTLKFFGMQAEVEPTVQFISFTVPPEKFDFEKYTNLDVKQIALGIGLDIQDIWELTGSGMGTATQSEILHTKSKGRALGRILKGLERTINQTLPEGLEFAFKYKDEEEDQANANLAQTWVGIGQALLGAGVAGDTVAQVLVNQVPALHDVMTDEAGTLRLPDDDPKTPEQETPSPTPQLEAPAAPEDEAVVVDDNKEIAATQQAVLNEFFQAAEAAQNGVISKRVMKVMLKTDLVSNGRRALIDGMRDGGIELPQIDKQGENLIGRWRTQQLPFVNKFADSVFDKEQSYAQLRSRAQMWVNKSINPLYYEGLAIAAKDKLFMWVLDPVKENCVTCLRLNGQVHKMKDFIASTFLPQAPTLACKGFQCGCTLVPSDQKASGRLGGKKRKPGVFRRIIGKIVSLFKEIKKAPFDEGKHPRDPEGQFGAGGGGDSDEDGGDGDDDSDGDDRRNTTNNPLKNPKHDKFSNVSDASDNADSFNEDWGTESNNWSDEEADSLGWYVGAESSDINNHLRTGEPLGEELNAERIENIDSVLDSRYLDHDIRTFRGDEGGGLPNSGKLSDEQFLSLRGDKFTDPSFTSTTINPNETFAGEYEYEFLVPKGSRGAYIGTERIGRESEQEFLIGRNTTSTIVDAYIDNSGQRRLILEVDKAS